MSAREAGLMWLGFAGRSRVSGLGAIGLAGAFLLAGSGALAALVLAIARTSSRLNVIGLVAALRARMLSRRADFLETGFSMATGRAAAFGGGGGAAFLGAGLLWGLGLAAVVLV